MSSVDWETAWGLIESHKKFIYFLGSRHDMTALNIYVRCSSDIVVTPNDFVDLVIWLKVNVTHLFTAASKYNFLFSDADEAAHFKLVWG
jgi:hypothetical protein